MFKHARIIMLLGVLVVACDSTKQPKKPENLISKDQMSELLYDLYIINGAKGVNKKLLETNGFNPETFILNKYNVDSTQFADSNTYYTFNSDVYKSIVDKVKARLEKEKSGLEELKKIEEESANARRDSVKKEMKLNMHQDSTKTTSNSIDFQID